MASGKSRDREVIWIQSRPKCVILSGRTYLIRTELKLLNADFNSANQIWVMPVGTAERAWTNLAETGYRIILSTPREQRDTHPDLPRPDPPDYTYLEDPTYTAETHLNELDRLRAQVIDLENKLIAATEPRISLAPQARKVG